MHNTTRDAAGRSEAGSRAAGKSNVQNVAAAAAHARYDMGTLHDDAQRVHGVRQQRRPSVTVILRCHLLKFCSLIIGLF